MRVRIESGTRRIVMGLIVTMGGALGLALSACGLFDIRDPVPPDDGPQLCQGESPTSSDIVIENFALAMDCREDGSGLFAQTLAEGYILKLDPTDAFELELLGVTRDTINRAETILAQERIVNSAEFPDSFLFVFTLVDRQDQGDSQAFYENMTYRLEMYQQDGDSTWLAAEYAGTVDLTVSEEEAGTWAISRWVDHRDGSLPPPPTLGSLYALKALTPG